MNQSLEARLRQLGVVKGTKNLKPASPPPKPPSPISFLQETAHDEPQPLEQLLPGGQVVETAESACFTFDKIYPLHTPHGQDTFQHLLPLSLAPAARFCRDERLGDLTYRDLLFLDTETTGLAGAGTVAFMVGVAFFEPAAGGDVLVVRQYFLRDFDDELAMLTLLEELAASKKGLVTFNGRSFDLPLLDNRYILNRLNVSLGDWPHIDLLPPSRRLWRNRLGGCGLKDLEQSLLFVQRTHEDIPGWLIPGLYQEYLRTGDAREMMRVFYHNQLDMLSMVTLMARVVRQFAHPQPDDHPVDLFSLGKWQLDLGLTAEGEQTIRQAAVGDLPLELYHEALYKLGEVLKRNGRSTEAVPLWQQIAATSFEDINAHVELAKFYEWEQQDYPTASQWVKQALALIKQGSYSRAALLRPELEHRLARLERKQNGYS